MPEKIFKYLKAARLHGWLDQYLENSCMQIYSHEASDLDQVKNTKLQLLI